jgi:hypothetical protein
LLIAFGWLMAHTNAFQKYWEKRCLSSSSSAAVSLSFPPDISSLPTTIASAQDAMMKASHELENLSSLRKLDDNQVMPAVVLLSHYFSHTS